MPFAAMRIYGVGLAFVITHSMAATPMCEPWCSNSCADLTGNVAYECGGCAVTEPGCRPGAAGWPDESSGVVRPAAETDDDGWPGVVRPAAETGEGPRLSPTTAGEGLGPAHMESLWPTTIYMAMQPEMETHNEELAALIEARFVRLESQLQRKGRSKDESLFDADDDLNALFHDQHRYGLSDAMRSARQCLREKAHIRPWQHMDRKAVEACEAEAAANSIWPELMNSTAFRSLFGHERGHIWRHLRRYAALLTGSHREGQWDATFAWDMTSDLDVWGTFHRDGLRHSSHSHDGSTFAGVYYVRCPEDARPLLPPHNLPPCPPPLRCAPQRTRECCKSSTRVILSSRPYRYSTIHCPHHRSTASPLPFTPPHLSGNPTAGHFHCPHHRSTARTARHLPCVCPARGTAYPWAEPTRI